MKNQLVVALSALIASAGPSLAESDLQPESLTVEPRISEGQHVYVMDFGINGSSQVLVLNADDFSLEGSIGTGTFGQVTMTPDKSALYTGAVYLSRYTYGDASGVVQQWNPATLELEKEIAVSPKIAQSLSQRGMVNRSADKAFLVVQNATPATSVTIADLEAGKDIAEIPTPGCWTAYPAAEGLAFSMLCGDGKIAKFTYAADGTFGEPVKSEKIFDSQSEPLWGDAMRVDGNLVYASYGGSLFIVDDSGDAPVLTDKYSFTEEGWAPSGYNLMAYHEPSGTMFILMHDKPFDGSHKSPAKEIWAIDMKEKKVVGRIEAHGETNIDIGGGDTPVLVGLDHAGGVHRYDLTIGETVEGKQTASRDGVVAFGTIILTDF